MLDDRQIDQAFIEIRADLSKLGGDMQKARQIINDATRTSGAERPMTPAARAYQEALRQTPGTDEYREVQRISNQIARQNRQTLIQEARDEVEARKRRTEELKAQMEARARTEDDEIRRKEDFARREELAAKQQQKAADAAAAARQKLWGIGGGNLGVMTGMGALIGGMQVARGVQGMLEGQGGTGAQGSIAGGLMQMLPIPGVQMAGTAVGGVSQIVDAINKSTARAMMPKDIDMSVEGRRQRAREGLEAAYAEREESGGFIGRIRSFASFMINPERTMRDLSRLGSRGRQLEEEVNDPNYYAAQQATEMLDAASPARSARRTATRYRDLARVLRDKARRGLEPRGNELADELERAAGNALAGINPASEREARMSSIGDIYRNAALVGANERYSRSGINPQARTADNTDKMAQLLNEMLNVLKGRNGGVKTAGAVLG